MITLDIVIIFKGGAYVKIFMKYKDYFIKTINSSVVFVPVMEEANEFGNMNVEKFISMKEILEKKEGKRFELTFVGE